MASSGLLLSEREGGITGQEFKFVTSFFVALLVMHSRIHTWNQYFFDNGRVIICFVGLTRVYNYMH
jgi:hypothetical protein